MKRSKDTQSTQCATKKKKIDTCETTTPQETSTTKPFSTEFNHVHTIGGKKSGKANTQFNFSMGVVIAHGCNVFLVRDYNNNRIQVFDLTSREFKASIKPPSRMPGDMCIETCYDGKNGEALLFSCWKDKCIYKYDLKQLIETCSKKKPSGLIWKSQPLSNPMNIVLMKEGEENMIYVNDFDTDTIEVLKASTGKVVQSISLGLKISCLCADVAEGNLWIAEQTNYEMHLLKKGTDGKWAISQTFSKKIDTSSHQGICFDAISQHLIVTLAGVGSVIEVYNKDGTLVKGFSDKDDPYDSLTGLCIDKLTGELYVCDTNRILIYN